MNTSQLLSALTAAALLAVSFAAAAAGGIASPRPTAKSQPAILLIAGMGGGGGGMGGSGGGMGGGGGGMGGGMSGGAFGGTGFGGMRAVPNDIFSNPAAAAAPPAGSPEVSYTYRCVTPAGHCSFVAPAWMRANSLRSGAACECGGGTGAGRVE